MKSAAGGLDEILSRRQGSEGRQGPGAPRRSLERGQLRTLVDNLKQKAGESVVVLGSAQPEGKVAIIAGVTPGLIKRIQAGKLVGAVAKLVGGSGGGKPNRRGRRQGSVTDRRRSRRGDRDRRRHAA